MNEELFNRLKAFVVDQAGVEDYEVIPEAKIEDDLRGRLFVGLQQNIQC